MIRRRRVAPNNITLVSSGENFQDARQPSLRLGDLVQLNSGSPTMIVVDIDDEITTAWRNERGHAVEGSFPLACVHRVSPV